jgi:hypothetical protein
MQREHYTVHIFYEYCHQVVDGVFALLLRTSEEQGWKIREGKETYDSRLRAHNSLNVPHQVKCGTQDIIGAFQSRCGRIVDLPRKQSTSSKCLAFSLAAEQDVPSASSLLFGNWKHF